MRKLILMSMLSITFLVSGEESKNNYSKYLLGDTYTGETSIKEDGSRLRVETTPISNKISFLYETHRFKNDSTSEKCIKVAKEKQKEIEKKYHIKFDTYIKYKKNNKKSSDLSQVFRNNEFYFLVKCSDPSEIVLDGTRVNKTKSTNSELLIQQKDWNLRILADKEKRKIIK